MREWTDGRLWYQVPVVCVDATPGAGAGAAADAATTPPPPGLLGAQDLPPLLVQKYSKPAAAAAVRLVTALRRAGVRGLTPVNPMAAGGGGAADERRIKAWMDAAGGSFKRRPVLEW